MYILKILFKKISKNLSKQKYKIIYNNLYFSTVMERIRRTEIKLKYVIMEIEIKKKKYYNNYYINNIKAVIFN